MKFNIRNARKWNSVQFRATERWRQQIHALDSGHGDYTMKIGVQDNSAPPQSTLVQLRMRAEDTPTHAPNAFFGCSSGIRSGLSLHRVMLYRGSTVRVHVGAHEPFLECPSALPNLYFSNCAEEGHEDKLSTAILELSRRNSLIRLSDGGEEENS